MGYDAFHKGKYYVTFKRGFEDAKKDIVITIDKVFENDSLRIILSDEEEPTFLCVIYVTRCDYEDLKKQQGLLIDFDNFPAQLVRLLQQCSSNNMFLILQQANPVQYHFEVVEHNEFRRLIHLSLKTGPASDIEVKKHMSEMISNFKKSLALVKNSLSSSEAMWSDKSMKMERKINDLTLAVAKMEEERIRKETECQDLLRQERDRLNQEKQQLQKTSELNSKVQITNLQEQLMRKDKQIDDLNTVVRQQKENMAQLENKISDKNQRVMLLENELQKSHIELATTKAKNTTLERDVMEREKQIHQINMNYSDAEKMLRDNAEVIREYNNDIRTLKKEKASLEERLAISESLVNKNNEAVHSSSEQLLKANQIISKQNTDLIEMKEKLLCRTAIALEQEKVIEKNTKEIEELKSEIVTTNQYYDKLKSELDTIKEKQEINERALKDKEETIKNNNMVIQWLHKKMEDNCAMSEMPTKRSQGVGSSSTPYFLQQKSNDTLQGLSDESINFYATSKSDVEESPGPEIQKNSNKVGLDPKYLKPASTEFKGPQSRTSSANQKGKENMNVNLPKVDYREKKSSRPSTFRATPVSAYFP